MAVTLASLFRGKRKDEKEAEADIAYPTGFLTFDYLNGSTVHVKSNDMDFTYDSVGIIDGSMVYAIGRSGCGKTTLLLQWAGNIIRPFKQSAIYYDNIEGGVTDSRKFKLLKMDNNYIEDHLIERNTGISAENLYERVKVIHDLKLENRDEFEYDTGKYDADGNKIIKFVPTVYILDSLAMLTPEKYTEEEELSGQMSVTAAAKMNTTVFKRIIPLLKKANIIFMVVNHITEDVKINPYQSSQGQLSYLKPGERLGGGRAVIYVANLLIRLDDHSKMDEKDGFGINGCLVDVTLLKSRTASAGSKVTLVFDYSNGFDPELSLLYFLKQNKLVNGAGAYLYIGDRSDLKFSQKKFKQKLRTDLDFRQVVMEAAVAPLRAMLKDNDQTDDSFDSFDLSQDIMSMMNNKMCA